MNITDRLVILYSRSMSTWGICSIWFLFVTLRAVWFDFRCTPSLTFYFLGNMRHLLVTCCNWYQSVVVRRRSLKFKIQAFLTPWKLQGQFFPNEVWCFGMRRTLTVMLLLLDRALGPGPRSPKFNNFLKNFSTTFQRSPFRNF